MLSKNERPAVIRKLCGSAGTVNQILENPLMCISKPLSIYQTGEQNLDFEASFRAGETPKSQLDQALISHVNSDPMFAIGGYKFVVAAGILSRYFEHDATRARASKIIDSRKSWKSTLQYISVKGRDAGIDDLYGKASLRKYFNSAPPTDKPFDAKKRKKINSPESLGRQRSNLCIRLRKAIEFIILTEATLAYRFSKGKAYQRVSSFTGIPESTLRKQEESELAMLLSWNILWVEPVHYCLSALPRQDDIPYIMGSNDSIETFEKETAQSKGALERILRGAVGRFESVQAANKIVNSFYPGLTQSNVTTCPPGEYKSRLRIATPQAPSKPFSPPEKIAILGPEHL